MTNPISQLLNLRHHGQNQYRLVCYQSSVKLVHKSTLSGWTLLKAQLGCGDASLKKIAKLLEKNKNLLDNTEDIKKFNDFIISYNKKKICWKRANLISVRILKSKSVSADNEMTLEDAFAECKKAYLNIGKSPDQFINQCAKMSSLIRDEEEDEALLCEILNFKNEVRAACLPAKAKALKGPCSFAKVKLDLQDQDFLRMELKKIREAILKKHFDIRLAKDEKQLNQLKAKWKIIKATKSREQIKCVETQLKRWDKKHKEGKPLSIPKWYHCTKSAQIQQLILESEVLFQSQVMPGAFVANYPVTSYGNFGLAFSSYIEKTAINDPIENIVYPKSTSMVNENSICYADEEQPRGNHYLPQVWFGFQRGRKAHYDSNAEKIGIPIHRKKIIESDQALNYYEDTSLSFIFNVRDSFGFNFRRGSETKVSQGFALANRVQILNQTEEEILIDLISQTFTLTLPIDWDGKINSSFY